MRKNFLAKRSETVAQFLLVLLKKYEFLHSNEFKLKDDLLGKFHPLGAFLLPSSPMADLLYCESSRRLHGTKLIRGLARDTTRILQLQAVNEQRRDVLGVLHRVLG